MNIAVIGIGGVGGYFGGKIANAFEDDKEKNIFFIARGKHLKTIQEHGLELITDNTRRIICRPTMATDEFDKLPKIDICFICVKSYDLNNVLENIKDKIKDDTEIIPLLNGVDIAQRIRKIIKHGVVYPACVYVGTHIKSPGVVVQSGGSCTIKFGKEKDMDTSHGSRIINILDKANINYEWTTKNYEEIWSKYMFIASYGLVTASYNKTIGEVYEDKFMSEKVVYIMKVIKQLAIREQVKLPDDIVTISYNKAKMFPYETKTSFQRDYEKMIGLDERDLFGKTIIEKCYKYKINSKYIEELFNKLI